MRLCYNVLMNGKEYLDQIAVKGTVKSARPILTPMLIKLIAAGVIALIAIITVGIIINNSNAKVTQTYERVYLRIHNLSNNNFNNPFTKYTSKIRDSSLQAHASSFFTVITSTDTKVSGLIGTVGVKTDKISKDVLTTENNNVSNLVNQLLDASYAGNIDRIYATNLSYQISTLIQYENEALKKTSNQSFANVLNESKTDLVNYQKQIQDWLDTH